MHARIGLRAGSHDGERTAYSCACTCQRAARGLLARRSTKRSLDDNHKAASEFFQSGWVTVITIAGCAADGSDAASDSTS